MGNSRRLFIDVRLPCGQERHLRRRRDGHRHSRFFWSEGRSQLHLLLQACGKLLDVELSQAVLNPLDYKGVELALWVVIGDLTDHRNDDAELADNRCHVLFLVVVRMLQASQMPNGWVFGYRRLLVRGFTALVRIVAIAWRRLRIRGECVVVFWKGFTSRDKTQRERIHLLKLVLLV